MTAPTPAVERAEEAVFGRDDSGENLTEDVRRGLAAALTDPADPDSLARTLFVLHATHLDWIPEEEWVLRRWRQASPRAVNGWRAVADGLRMMLTGSAS